MFLIKLKSGDVKLAFHDIHSSAIIKLTLCIFAKIYYGISSAMKLIGFSCFDFTRIGYYANMILVASFMGL